MRCVLLLLVMQLMPALTFAQAILENPAPGSAQSGIGIVSGWRCVASGPITVTFDDGAPFQAAYGTSREDTRAACGDADNGFGLLFNWSILGDGQHSVKVFDNGVQFGSAIVTVATFGTEFLTGQTGTGTLTFAGRTVTVQWSETGQNFVVTSVVGAPIGELPDVAGIWRISGDFLSENCNWLSVPGDLPSTLGGTLNISQNGTLLTVSQGTSTLTGDVEPNGDFSIVTQPVINTLSGGCLQTIILGEAGNFIEGSAIITQIFGFSESCSTLLNSCAVIWSGTISRSATLSDDTEYWNVEDLVEGAEHAARAASGE